MRVAVVGGGVAGISAADRLRSAGHEAEIFERADRLGGRIGLDRLNGREVCLGGKNIGREYSEFRALVARAGPQEYEFFGPETSQIVRGRLRPMSFSNRSVRIRLGARLVVRPRNLVGGRRFLKLARRVKREESSRFLGDAWFAALTERTGDPPLDRYFGRTFSTAVIRHVTVRMNGAEPDEARLGNFGSNLALVVDKFDQLVDGLEPVIRPVAERHRVHTAAAVDSLLLQDGAPTGVVTADGREHAGFDAVALAVPAPVAAAIVGSRDEPLASLLRSIVYHPVAVVVAEYDRPVFPPEFAAIAVPHRLALSNAGSYGLGDRHVVRFTFSGRAARGRIERATFDPERLLAEAEEFLARYVPIAVARRTGYVARAFEPGLCAYRRDHAGFLAGVDERLREVPGLALAGDYMRGASLEACSRSGIDAATRLHQLRGARERALV